MNLLSKCLGLRTVSLNYLVREQLKIDSGLTKEIRKYLDSGDIIPKHLTEQLISSEIMKKSDGDVLISEYPRTVEQFESMEKFLSKLMIKVSRIWYFKQADFNQFTLHFYEEHKQWTDKYGDEMKNTWTEKHNKKTAEIRLLKQMTEKCQWIDIDLTYETFRDSVYIENTILKNHAQQNA